MLQSPASFFIQLPEYDTILKEECYILSKYAGMDILSVENISTWDRKSYLSILRKDVDEQNKRLET